MAEVRQGGPDVGTETLETGSVTFLYRPRVGRERPRSRDDVQRLYVLFAPEGQRCCRLLVIGRKMLPEPSEPGHARYWGFVDAARAEPGAVRAGLEGYTYVTRTRGTRHQPGARVAGQGLYAIVRHGDHVHLTYELREPHELGRLQEELHVRPRASYVVVARDPDADVPEDAEVPTEPRVRLPRHLRARFGRRRFAPADPELLDQEGLDLILIAVAEDFDDALAPFGAAEAVAAR